MADTTPPRATHHLDYRPPAFLVDSADLSAGPRQPAISFIHGGSAIPVKNSYQLPWSLTRL